MIKGPTIITGGSRGMGRAIANRVAEDGGAVGLWARDLDLLEQVAEELSGKASKVHIEVVDVSDEDAVRRAADQTEAALGGIRAVVNNAGIAHPGSFDDLTITDWDRLFAINTRGVMLVTKLTLPAVRRMGGGCYVNIASEVGRLNQAGNVAYGASKFAVVGFTQGLGLELAPEGIRVNCVIPGPVHTDMWDDAMSMRSKAENRPPQEISDEVLSTIPLGRFPNVNDVAEAVAFMLDDDRAGAIVGECLFVTGGSTVY
jgi:NAD(P)-dependent dehydrogenase (short-subunit alcohol dehydrogenase family)